VEGAVAGAVEQLESRWMLAAGLLGSYYQDPQNNTANSYNRDRVLYETPRAGQRTDPIINFIATGNANNQDPNGGGAFHFGDPLNGGYRDQRLTGTGLTDSEHIVGRWEGTITPDVTDDYTFFTRSDDGVRLSVNGQTLVSQWYADRDVPIAPGDVASTVLTLTGGQSYPVVLEFNQGGGGAAVGLYWKADLAHPSPEFVPTTALNDTVTMPAKPGTPVQVPANVALPRADRLYFTWNDVAKNETHYRIERQGPGDAGFVAAGYVPFNSTAFALNGLTANTQYQVRVVAVTSAGEVASDPVTLTTAASNPVAGTGLKASHFDNGGWNALDTNFTGPKAVFLDTQVDDDWGNNSPTTNLPATDPTFRIGVDNLSSRFEGFLTAEVSGNYRLFVQVDDGAQVTLGGNVLEFYDLGDVNRRQLLLSRDGGIGNTFTHADSGGQILTVALQAGVPVPITIESDESGGGAGIRVQWEAPELGITRQAIPTSALSPLVNPAMTGTVSDLAVVRAANGRARLTWSDSVENEDVYQIDRAAESAPGSGVPGTFEAIRRVGNVLDYTDDAPVTPGVRYFYRVRGASLQANGSWVYSGASNGPVSLPALAANAGIQGQYFDNGTQENVSQNFTGPWVLKVDPIVDARGNDQQSPVTGSGSAPTVTIAPTTFSARWTGYIVPTVSGAYGFGTNTDDGFRLLLDDDNNGSLTEYMNGMTIGQGDGAPEVVATGAVGSYIRDYNEGNAGHVSSVRKFNLVAGQRYRVVMEMDQGGGGWGQRLLWQTPSDPAFVAIPSENLQLPDAPAQAPAGFAAAPGALGVNLTWTQSATDFGIVGYIVERAVDANNDNVPDGAGFAQIHKSGNPISAYTDNTGLAAGTKYLYRVRSFNVAGESPNSVVAAATTLQGSLTGTPPTVTTGPTNLTTQGPVDWRHWGSGAVKNMPGRVVAVVAEAESGTIADGTDADGNTWAVVADAGASGGQALQANDADTANNVAGYVTYSFNFPQPGTYRLYLRRLTPPGVGNSIWGPGGLDAAPNTGLTNRQFDNATESASYIWTASDGTTASTLAANNPVTVEVTDAGTHTITLGIREQGYKFDKVALVLDNNGLGSTDAARQAALDALPGTISGISNYTKVGPGAVTPTTTPTKTFSWTNSTPHGIDVTAPDSTVEGSTSNFPAAESPNLAIDNDIRTKYLNFDELGAGLTITPSAADAGKVVTGLGLTSANDAPTRDPATYLLEGSNDDGGTWTTVSSGSVPVFSGRFTRQEIRFANTVAYGKYRLTFPTNRGAGEFQIAEVQLLNFGNAVSATNANQAVQSTGAGNGFRFTLPASSALKQRATVYVGVNGGSGTLTASLSDNSAGQYLVTITDSNPGDGVTEFYQVPIEYKAALTGQTLNVDWVAQSGTVVLQAAAITETEGPAAPTQLVATPPDTARTVRLSWLDNAVGETGYKVFRATEASPGVPGPFVLIQSLPADSTAYADRTASPLTKYYYKVAASGNAIDSADSNVVNATTAAMTAPWTNQDVGGGANNPTVPGDAAFNAAGPNLPGTARIYASGGDIWNAADGFHFVYQQVTGNFTITAHVLDLQNTNEWAKSGVMVRETLTGGSRHGFMAATALQGVRAQGRTVTDGDVNFNDERAAGSPDGSGWVRIKRLGDTMEFYHSLDGTTWTLEFTQTYDALPATVYTGLAVTSHANGVVTVSNFDNVTIVPLDATPPKVTGVAIDGALPATATYTPKQHVVVKFSEAIGTVDTSNVQITAADGTLVATAGQITWEFDAASNSAVLTFTGITNGDPGGTDTELPDGNYKLRLTATGVNDQDGNALDGDGDNTAGGDFEVSFYVLRGDTQLKYDGTFNGDRKMDFVDFQRLERNFGKDAANGDRPTHADGDFNHDGKIDQLDLKYLVNNQPKTLPPPGAPAPVPVQTPPPVTSPVKPAPVKPTRPAPKPAPAKPVVTKPVAKPVAKPAVTTFATKKIASVKDFLAGN
jgi:hypothetical protein